MSVATLDPQPGPRPRRTLLWPIVWTVLLVPAVVLVPFPLASAWSEVGYSSPAALEDSLTSAFVGFWAAGTGVIGADLARPVAFWSHFHVVKAVLATVLLVALVLVCCRSWEVSTHAASRARRLAAGALSAVAALMSLVALVVVVANVQGAVAPLSSSLGLLPLSRPDGELSEVVGQVRLGLAGAGGNPALDTLVRDFTTYHVAMVVLGVVVTVGLLATAVLGWRRRSRLSQPPHRGRGLLTGAVVAVLASCAFFAVVTAGNVSTVAHPAPALLGFFQGGV
jgi:hypothetical protein